MVNNNVVSFQSQQSQARKEDAPEPPKSVGEWTIRQTIEVLGRELPESYLKNKIVDRRNGTRVKYLPWYRVTEILDKYCPGWEFSVSQPQFAENRIYVFATLKLHCKDGVVSRSAYGSVNLLEEKFDRTTREVYMEESSFGDPSSNAQAKALRRCAALFNLGRYLWYKD